MATSKTLTPTNVTIQIPAFADKPDQRVNSNCIDKEADAINALSDQIESINGKYKTSGFELENGGSKTITVTGSVGMLFLRVPTGPASCSLGIVMYGVQNTTVNVAWLSGQISSVTVSGSSGKTITISTTATYGVVCEVIEFNR